MIYSITYLNLETLEREVYMNNTSFSEKGAIDEIKRLKEQQEQYVEIGFYRTRAYFKYEIIKLRSISK